MLKRLDVKLEDMTAEGAEISGYGSVFGNVDQGGDVVESGAFALSLARHKSVDTMPAMLFQHDVLRPVGVWTEMREDAKGLYVEGRLVTETPDGAAVAALMRAGAMKGLSVGYRTVQSRRDSEGRRVLTELDLWEVSPVVFPMNRAAGASIKSMDDVSTIRECQEVLRDAGLSKKEAASFISRVKSIIADDRDGRHAFDKISRIATSVRGS